MFLDTQGFSSGSVSPVGPTVGSDFLEIGFCFGGDGDSPNLHCCSGSWLGCNMSSLSKKNSCNFKRRPGVFLDVFPNPFRKKTTR